ISQKESQKWLASLAAVDSARVECPTTRFISVGDREADVYDLLAATRPAGVELLLRAAWDRCVQAPERYVWATVAAQPVAESLRLQVPLRGGCFMPPCWPGQCPRCLVTCCWRSRNGRRCIVPSITVPHRLKSPQRWSRLSVGLHSSVVLWDAVAATNREPRHCGVAFNI